MYIQLEFSSQSSYDYLRITKGDRYSFIKNLTFFNNYSLCLCQIKVIQHWHSAVALLNIFTISGPSHLVVYLIGIYTFMFQPLVSCFIHVAE